MRVGVGTIGKRTLEVEVGSGKVRLLSRRQKRNNRVQGVILMRVGGENQHQTWGGERKRGREWEGFCRREWGMKEVQPLGCIHVVSGLFETSMLEVSCECLRMQRVQVRCSRQRRLTRIVQSGSTGGEVREHGVATPQSTVGQSRAQHGNTQECSRIAISRGSDKRNMICSGRPYIATKR